MCIIIQKSVWKKLKIEKIYVLYLIIQVKWTSLRVITVLAQKLLGILSIKIKIKGRGRRK